MIDLSIHEEALARTIELARDRRIIIPTFEQMRHPERIPAPIRRELENIGLWDVNPLNLFRITWKNAPVPSGGGFGGVNFIELPSELTGVPARIVMLVGKWFPTGAHKVGAAFGCLAPRLVTGQFDPSRQKAVWPSTGNYCRGGAYDSALLGCESVAILPEGMSSERFEWLSKVAGTVIKTPGSESNVKEIFDKCWELRKSGEDLMIFNQFDEFGNYLWHYNVTGAAIEEALGSITGDSGDYKGVVLSTGSGGTLACGDYLKKLYPWSKIAASEALQCPTLLQNGFGEHRIEGIGDKHVPWIHNVRNTDMVVAVDDEAPMRLIRLFNEPAGQDYLVSRGVDASFVEQLNLLGISGVANALAAVKFAKYYELGSEDVVFSIATDSMEMYGSRLEEMREAHGPLETVDAATTFERHLLGTGIENMLELRHYDRKRVHNLKYYTWVEQQAKDVEDLRDQWSKPRFWNEIGLMADEIDALITDFNQRTGLLEELESNQA